MNEAEGKLLTRAELQLMLHLWSLPGASGFVNDVRACYEEPRPAYTTVATFMKILSKKGFLRGVKTGNVIYYTARVARQQYLRETFDRICNEFFEGNAEMMRRYVEGEFQENTK